MTDPETLQAAVDEVRREGRKASAVSATADGLLALLAVNLALTVMTLDVPSLPVVPVETRAVLAVLVGLGVAAVSVVVRARRNGVERFEAVNPELGAALRSARDAAESAHENAMAKRLYADALDRLTEASSDRLVDERRLAARMIVVFALAMGSIHVAVVDVSVDPLAGASGVGDGDVEVDEQRPDEGSGDSPEELDSDSLRDADGSDVLGEPGDVKRGEDALTADLSDGGEGAGDERARYENSGHPSGRDVSPERAGYDDPSEIEDPDLVREYALRVSEDDNDD